MKKYVKILMIIVIFLLALQIKVFASDNDIVHIEDNTLKKYLIEDYDVNGDGKLSKLEMEKIESINYSRMGVGSTICSISGLEYATNLESLDLSSNSITDITPLKNLKKLYYLNLSGNEITDITPLKNLKKLYYLDLSCNVITDITALTNLTNLEVLELSENQIKDITPLENLINLRVLYLSLNYITDITALSNMTNLQWLYLERNQITDITALSNLTNLTLRPVINYIDLSNNRITDITPLKNLKFHYDEYVSGFDVEIDLSYNYIDLNSPKTLEAIEVIEAIGNNSFVLVVEPQNSLVEKGDIDEDGEITSFDAYNVLEKSLGGEELLPEEISISDIDKDGEVTSFDAYLILSYSTGMIDESYWD